MASRTLSSPPRLLPLYARAAVAMLPGSSLLPFVPGGGGEMPELELTLPGVRPDPEKVAAYAKVCGFSLRHTLPATYPHVLAFPLHMAAMADGHFPFGSVGLVHVENRIVQRRPTDLGEELEIRVRAGRLEPHPRGRAFSFATEAMAAGETVWEEVSTFLRRGGGTPSGAQAGERAEAAAEEAELAPTAEWRLPGDLGRRYAAVSGDRNPIHMHPLPAKLLGFPQAIAHGMWTKARCLAELEDKLPGAFAVDVHFRKPIPLPGTVSFAESGAGAADRTGAGALGETGATVDFAVRDAARGTTHLRGRVVAGREQVQSAGGGR